MTAAIAGFRFALLAALSAPLLALAQSPAEPRRLVPLPAYRAFVARAARGETIRVAYLGGSITVGATTSPDSGTNREGKPYAYDYNQHRDSWRALTFEWLRRRFEKRPGQFEQVDAAMGSTNSTFGAYRLAKDVLAYRPDLLFIEFAINDNRNGAATERDPAGDSSIYRNYQSLVSRVQAANPDAALFITISAHRPGSVATAFDEKTKFDASARITERAANYFRIPYLRIRDVFYRDPLPPGLERDRLFDGPETAGNEVHPSAQGHQAYAAGVIRTLERIFSTFEFAFVDVNLPAPRPYPQVAALYVAREIQPHARGWEIKPMPARWAIEPCLQGEASLVTSDPNATLMFPFFGRAIGAWFDTDGRGAVEIYVDGRRIGVHSSKEVPGRGADKIFPGRANVYASGLDPKVRHEFKLAPVKGQGAFVVSLHGILVEETTDHGRDRLPPKAVNMAVFRENPRPKRRRRPMRAHPRSRARGRLHKNSAAVAERVSCSPQRVPTPTKTSRFPLPPGVHRQRRRALRLPRILRSLGDPATLMHIAQTRIPFWSGERTRLACWAGRLARPSEGIFQDRTCSHNRPSPIS